MSVLGRVCAHLSQSLKQVATFPQFLGDWPIRLSLNCLFPLMACFSSPEASRKTTTDFSSQNDQTKHEMQKLGQSSNRNFSLQRTVVLYDTDTLKLWHIHTSSNNTWPNFGMRKPEWDGVQDAEDAEAGSWADSGAHHTQSMFDNVSKRH